MEKSVGSKRRRVLQSLLRTIRKETGLTQKALAERLATSHSRISDYETGQRRMDVLQLRDYLAAQGIGLEAFVVRLEQELKDHDA